MFDARVRSYKEIRNGGKLPMDDEPIWQCCFEKPKIARTFIDIHVCLLIRNWPSLSIIHGAVFAFLLGMLIYWMFFLWGFGVQKTEVLWAVVEAKRLIS